MTENEKSNRPAISYLVEIYKRSLEQQKRERRRAIVRRFSAPWRWTIGQCRRAVRAVRGWLGPKNIVLPTDDPDRLRLGWIIYDECGFPVIADYAMSRVEVGKG
jgi:hypothetical protein